MLIACFLHSQNIYNMGHLNFYIALSHWCIFHRSKAEVVVATWSQQFHRSDMTQKVPLLYLSNDILQNSKRKGNEFVIEFWKVLPGALKDVYDKDDDQGKKVVSRLVCLLCLWHIQVCAYDNDKLLYYLFFRFYIF